MRILTSTLSLLLLATLTTSLAVGQERSYSIRFADDARVQPVSFVDILDSAPVANTPPVIPAEPMPMADLSREPTSYSDTVLEAPPIETYDQAPPMPIGQYTGKGKGGKCGCKSHAPMGMGLLHAFLGHGSRGKGKGGCCQKTPCQKAPCQKACQKSRPCCSQKPMISPKGGCCQKAPVSCKAPICQKGHGKAACQKPRHACQKAPPCQKGCAKKGCGCHSAPIMSIFTSLFSSKSCKCGKGGKGMPVSAPAPAYGPPGPVEHDQIIVPPTPSSPRPRMDVPPPPPSAGIQRGLDYGSTLGSHITVVPSLDG